MNIGNGVAAHRGNMSVYPENTMPAFESAVKLGCSWLELDIQSTGDGKIVVTHDENALRVTGENKIICASTFRELSALNFGAFLNDGNQYALPLLSEVFELIKHSGTGITIQPKMNGVVKPAISIAKDLGVLDRIAFNEVNCEYLVEAKRQQPGIPVFWDRLPDSDVDTDIYLATELGLDCLMYVYNGLTRETVEKVKNAGLECGVCVVNDPEEMDKFLSWDIQMFYTDYPEILLNKK